MNAGIFTNVQSPVAHDDRLDIYDVRFQAWFVLTMSLASLGLGLLMDSGGSPIKRIFTLNPAKSERHNDRNADSVELALRHYSEEGATEVLVEDVAERAGVSRGCVLWAVGSSGAIGWIPSRGKRTLKRIFARNGKYRVAVQVDHCRVPEFAAAEPANLVYGVGDTREAARKDAIRIASMLRRAGLRVLIGQPEMQPTADFSSFY